MRLIFAFILLLSVYNSFSQSIASEIINSNIDKHNGKIKSILENITFYNTDNVELKRTLTQYDTLGHIVSFISYDENNKVKGTSFYSYDSLNRLIRNDRKYYVNAVGFVEDYSKFEYDEFGNKKRQFECNKNNEVVTWNEFVYDSNKNLILLKLFNSSGVLQGYEKASYDTVNNIATVSVYNSNNEQLSNNKQPIKFGAKYNHDTTKIYNEHDDIIFRYRKWNENDDICYKNEYEYDVYGNEIFYKNVEYQMKKNGKLKKRGVKQIKKRLITYY